jgi:heptosyltransferase-3
MFKCWPHEKVAELIDLIQGELEIPVVLTSGPDEQERAYIKDLLDRIDTEVIDLSGILSLKELGAVIRGARLFFGIDSAPMHISAALKTPVVVLFGPTSSVDWGPWPPRGEGHRIITSTRHDCIPCGRDGCDGSKVSDCLIDLDIATVFQAVKEQLQSLPGEGED